MADDLKEGCDLCGDWPVAMRGRCHPTAPLRAELQEDGTLILRCYVPECGREVWSGQILDRSRKQT